MKIEYLVGIDYGDGETTAAIVNINMNEDARSLQIAKGSAKDQKKVDSAIVFKEDSIISNIEESIKRYLEEAENKWPFDIY